MGERKGGGPWKCVFGGLEWEESVREGKVAVCREGEAVGAIAEGSAMGSPVVP